MQQQLSDQVAAARKEVVSRLGPLRKECASRVDRQTTTKLKQEIDRLEKMLAQIMDLEQLHRAMTEPTIFANLCTLETDIVGETVRQGGRVGGSGGESTGYATNRIRPRIRTPQRAWGWDEGL